MYKKENVRKLQTAYNRIFRTLMNFKYDVSISAQFVSKNIDTFTVIWRKLIVSFRKRLLESENSIISGIVQSLMFLDSRLTKMWHDKAFSL